MPIYHKRKKGFKISRDFDLERHTEQEQIDK